MAEEVTLPALGESVTEGTVTRWLKQVGDSVAVDEPLLEVSTDKVDTEIPSPVAGTLLEIKAEEDETVEVGAELAVRAFVCLGPLSPDDVHVQLVHGRALADDSLADAVAFDLTLAESYEGGRHRFDGLISLVRSGAFGYTVRVLPRNDLLASPAELGVVAFA